MKSQTSWMNIMLLIGVSLQRDLKHVVKELVDDETKTSNDQRSRIQAELLLGKLEPLHADLDTNKNMTLDSAMKKVESKKLKVMWTTDTLEHL